MEDTEEDNACQKAAKDSLNGYYPQALQEQYEKVVNPALDKIAISLNRPAMQGGKFEELNLDSFGIDNLINTFMSKCRNILDKMGKSAFKKQNMKGINVSSDELRYQRDLILSLQYKDSTATGMTYNGLREYLDECKEKYKETPFMDQMIDHIQKQLIDRYNKLPMTPEPQKKQEGSKNKKKVRRSVTQLNGDKVFKESWERCFNEASKLFEAYINPMFGGDIVIPSNLPQVTMRDLQSDYYDDDDFFDRYDDYRYDMLDDMYRRPMYDTPYFPADKRRKLSRTEENLFILFDELD